jgi:2-oxo-4-hydroxy-4-carboxy--5-ureidoimidazoline (OHCU) decarboxylase
MTSLPPISTLPHSPDTTLTTVLDLLFEPSPPLHALTLPVLRSTTFPSYDVLITAVHAQLTALAASDIATLSQILCSHPRLGEKKVDSEQSRKEQARLQGGEEEGRKLASLNEEYEAKFPGLRYVYVQEPLALDFLPAQLQPIRRVLADVVSCRANAKIVYSSTDGPAP